MFVKPAVHRPRIAPRTRAPSRLAAAVVSVQDEHFYSNFAINVLSGVGRPALAALQTEQDPRGSTIEQQLG